MAEIDEDLDDELWRKVSDGNSGHVCDRVPGFRDEMRGRA
jgi:hypothetical protein